MQEKLLIIYIFLNLFAGKIIGLITLSTCVVPPLKCPNVNITFWLYTRANEIAPYEISVTNPDTIASAPWVKDAPIKVLIHGYTGDKDFSPNTEIRPAYLKSKNYNILSVDYKPLALEPCYIQAANNAELVGMCTAQIIDEMVVNHGFRLSDIHPIGFSLGGQILGFIANYIKSGRMDRITALDPALPLFATIDVTKKVDRSDAKFVDALHTNALARGKLEPIGHIDFYANGGFLQPGCPDSNASISSCSHGRAPMYYAESINTDVGFYGKQCPSLFLTVICNIFNHDKELVLFGEYVPRNKFGSFFFETNSAPPFSKGKT